MQKINCDDCGKKSCSQRIEGALCNFNPDIQDMIVIGESRDPKLMAMKMAEIMGTEMSRYRSAVSMERIGEDIEFTYINDEGISITEKKKGNINPSVTQLAHSIIKNGNIINNILNPPKAVPMFQQNNQYNFGSPVARAIESLGGDDKTEAIKFLDERINGLKQGS